MRNFFILFVGFVLLLNSSCQNPATDLLKTGSELPAPPIVNQNGLSLQIISVESTGEKVSLNLKAINGSDDKYSLGDNYDKLILRDNLGNEYQTKGENLDLLPLTVNDLQIEFLAKLPSDAKTLSLTTNSKSSSMREPRIVLENIPVSSGKITFTPAPNPPNLTLSDKTFNHPNGTSFTINQINFGENTIEVSFQAVNGSGRDNEFSMRNERSFLQDDKSNRYYPVPANSDNNLKLSKNEKMNGTFRFGGKLAPDATKISLHLNDSSGSDNEYSTSPKIVIGDIQIKN